MEIHHFIHSYETSDSFDTNKSQIIAKCFAHHLPHKDLIPYKSINQKWKANKTK